MRALDAVISPYVGKTLRVDTEGSWLNGRRKFSHQDSKRIWGLAPGNAPGRFLGLLADKTASRAAILETNLFCSGPAGLGYNAHDIGVFSNVYGEHLGSVRRLKTARDIAEAKSFIFSRITQGGYAVFNADNQYVLSQLERIPKTKGVTRVACSAEGKPANALSDIQIYIEDGAVICRQKDKIKALGALTSYKMYLPGFPASAMNVLLALGALTGFFEGELPADVVPKLQAYRPQSEDGRLIVFESKKGARIIFDFAHEQKSLRAVAELGRSLSPNGKVIGVLRLSPTKTEASIKKIAREISGYYDHFVIYDKIDGTTRKPNDSLSPFRAEKTGFISEIFSQALRAAGAAAVERIIEEDRALKRAVSIAGGNDVIVFIQGNDAGASLTSLRRNFNYQLKRVA